MQVYVLTREINMYDQDGEYFVKVFKDMPKPEQLWEVGVPQNRTRHVMNGGGRVGVEHEWFILRRVEL